MGVQPWTTMKMKIQPGILMADGGDIANFLGTVLNNENMAYWTIIHQIYHPVSWWFTNGPIPGHPSEQVVNRLQIAGLCPT